MARLLTFDRKAALREGAAWVLGVDEVGRGALAGPVVAGAVALRLDAYERLRQRALVREVNDSKQLDARRRLRISRRADDWEAEGILFRGTARCEAREIDEWNVLEATRRAMIRALEEVLVKGESAGLVLPRDGESLSRSQRTLWGEDSGRVPNSLILIDGRPFRSFPYAHRGVVKGDTLSFCIALASIGAKVERDAWMAAHEGAGVYGWASNKGYGTTYHREQILRAGMHREHRISFLESPEGGQVHEDQRQLECFSFDDL